jgi:hypothetical protein
VAPGAAQGVVDAAWPVDAHERGQQASADASQFGGQCRVDPAVEEEPRSGLVHAGDVVDQIDEVVADQWIAADEDEAARAERGALVDRVAPLTGAQLVACRRGRVVAVTAGAAAAVRDVEVDLAQSGEWLAAQRVVPRETVEHAEVGRLVHVHPERQLSDLQARGLCRAQRVIKELRAAHGGARQQLRERLGAGVPGLPAGADEVIAAVRGGTEDDPAGGEVGKRLLQVLRRERGAVAADDDHGSGAGGEEVREDAGEPLAEVAAALLQPGPATAAGECIDGRGGASGRRRLGEHQRRIRQSFDAGERTAKQALVHGQGAVVAQRLPETGLDGAPEERARHHGDRPVHHALDLLLIASVWRASGGATTRGRL